MNYPPVATNIASAEVFTYQVSPTDYIMLAPFIERGSEIGSIYTDSESLYNNYTPEFYPDIQLGETATLVSNLLTLTVDNWSSWSSKLTSNYKLSNANFDQSLQDLGYFITQEWIDDEVLIRKPINDFFN